MAAQIGTPYNGPMGPDQNRCHVGPRFTSTAPCRNPRPSAHSFPRVGPAILWCRAQSRCDGLGAKPFKIRPLDKDDAVPMGEQSMCRSCGGLGGVYEVTTDAP